MGNSLSSKAKDETHRSNRLSKPLTKKFNASQSSQRPEADPSAINPGLIGWQNPWVGKNSPSASVEKRGSYSKKAGIPPTLFETKLPEETPTEDRTSGDQSPTQCRPTRPALLSATSSRRTSYQSEPWESASQCSPLHDQPPKRASSTRVPLQRHNSAVYETQIGDATSSNTHFLVGNQRFSLTRRRSLLTRPGVATRRASVAIRRVPSPIGEPENPIEDPTESTVLQWPLPLAQRSLRLPSPVRPASPMDARYTQLGALKLGSLRVVNGSASPCPSERIPLEGSCAPGSGLGLENIEVVGPSRGSTLEIPSLPDLKRSDDVPDSPFSFEKSPTITIQPRRKSLFPGDPEDEGIVLCDDTRIQLEKGVLDVGLSRSTSQSLTKSDSGYSSATSVHSMPRSRTQSSAGSRTSGSCGADSSKNVCLLKDLNSDRPADKALQNLQTSPDDCSRLYPAASRWYDASVPTPLAPSRSRRSTLCAPRYTEYFSPRESFVEFQSTAVISVPYQSHQGFTRGLLYGDRLSMSSFGPASATRSATSGESQLSHQRPTTQTKERLRRSVSEYQIHEGYDTQLSRPRSRLGSRIWSKNPGAEVPPPPTMTSPGYLQEDLDFDAELASSEPMRGRPRSRNNDYHRRRLTKAHHQTDLCT
ncbi:hypothetical protein Pdw03_4601 [Penicillium digitatum]|uniref:Uncharacterized protein n=3 Tax=Penicillium digitatum TaxID=36651 RepID=K9G5R7_PEND2|nr:hypothetical protein PDIP_68250 [Penicillium digitatum Pd1]EKV08533.1 hypothetical protein PDIP_68250 [Penicillium digitatum Pd1]EKV10188.1 hypothetical protein PDIG_58790 [Penicillium digitatum PHI26]KAG0158761.1 hypothetical protein PDIDSM_6280 [Penicillium digitatum]QQK41747.1 hypothetical protein Pdw03_4601 [Penicillium digitatum]